MNHTPGSWIYRKGDEWSHSIVTQHGELPDGSPAYWTVASVNNNRDEKEANARLISSAPDLLLALGELSAAYERLKPAGYPKADAQKLAEAAIAKATGN